MLGSFKKTLKKQKKLKPPQEVVSAIEKDIPKNFMLQYDENDGLALIPKTGETINASISFTDETIELLKEIPKDKWLIYLYRTQKIISVKDVVVGDEKNKISIALVGNNPLQEIDITDVKMYPQPFGNPITISCDTEEGDCIDLKLQQVVYDSWEESKFENIDHKAIKIELYINDVDVHKSRIVFSVSPQSAGNVAEAVTIVHLFKGLLNGTAKINGQKATPNKLNPDVDYEQLQISCEFWEDALQLEMKLGVSFNPAEDFPAEKVGLFAELAECLIRRKSVSWKHPFESFQIKGITQKNQLDKLAKKGKLTYTFIEGPNSYSLLGTTFELYCYCELQDIVIKKIDWDDEDEMAEVFVDDADDKEWVMTRFYLANEEMKRVEEMLKTKSHITIPTDIDN